MKIQVVCGIKFVDTKMVCQLKCMNSHLEVCRYFAGKSQNLKIANYFVLEEYAEKFVTSMLEKDVPFRCYS